MYELGVVGLDTSHPAAFAEVLTNCTDATIGAVWDGGRIRDSDYVDEFCAEYDVRQMDDLDLMAESVDGAMILTVDWTRHVPLATKFLSVGVPTLIDKPLAGDVGSIQSLKAATKEAPLFGGSAVPFHPKLTTLPDDSTKRMVFAAGYNDFFYYRTHLSDTVRRLAGSPWITVERTADPGTTLRIIFENGVHSMIRCDGRADDGTFAVLDVTDDGTHAIEIKSGESNFANLYRPYLESFIEVIRGERDDTETLLDAASLGLAVEAALDTDEQVEPDDELLTNVRMDSESFVDSYEPYY
ncbi:Oxidoreductase family, NAD-binding Rossmann fold [Halogranum amylolyticum]|uniref:Oxidoreductase family, NAD-binding Rossmann fold n=1 Tax=Halogranum amylolyticum TaxID=660520 RepID=A0A1H8UHQ6_9EURY|nr:Gfo/Idh/MocA family oxidoreductase [Halogranum amylolyticum]SEP02749.1 Oxidoreductase family, NAD-binding Rossmann fold [Halogranum amylolyticum]